MGMKSIYSDRKTEATVGDVVAYDNVRGIVTELKGTFVKLLVIGTSKKTGETFVLPQMHYDERPASVCYYIQKADSSIKGWGG
jgi:hypothetical protein